MMNKRIVFVSIDVLILMVSFLFFAWLKPGTKAVIIPQYVKPFVFFLLVWTISSLTTKKYIPERFKVKSEIFKIILQANFVSLAIVSIFIYTFKLFSVSRFLLLGTIVLSSLLELLFAWFYNIILTSQVVDIENGKSLPNKFDYHNTPEGAMIAGKHRRTKKPEQKSFSPKLLNMIGIEFGEKVKELIKEHVGSVKGNFQIVSTTTRFNITSLPEDKYNCIINLHRVNDIRWLNKFFESVNEKLAPGGVFIGKAETYKLRKQRILRKYIVPFNYLVYIFDFVYRRVTPKLPILKRLFFWITKGRNRLLSRAETLGRLYSCGFKVIDEKFIDDELYFVAAKNGAPLYPKAPTYGPLVRLRRIGKNGNYFYVYKMRTMHPYSEYLQEYIYEKNNLAQGGKFEDDFRVNTIGKIMRKIWFDELPMFLNVFKGDMKIVGVRPLSSHYFNLYTDELKQQRIKFKPGLVPPFYVDLPDTLDEIMESEKRYLDAYEKSPFLTDLKYFFIAWRNIIFKKARSR
jgi:lipopolysaccharide/colanic/teichoic acid biosynthesis glycosyltransferase